MWSRFSHPSAMLPNHGETIVRNNAQVNPNVAGAARELGLHSKSSRGVANSHEREPRRLNVVERRMRRACSSFVLAVVMETELMDEEDAVADAVVRRRDVPSVTAGASACLLSGSPMFLY
mmetsp:Transcript_9426/g.16386  ORF Transcript_9426/g.16386 Transcript_9426/m.16386 type:complete len:120 (-) Transcript_9426:60-419(-)